MEDETTPFNELKKTGLFTVSEGLLYFNKVLPTWNAVVLYCVQNKDYALLALYGVYRAAIVNNIIRACIRTSCVTCTYGTSGSKHLTSDYDINVSGESSDMVVTMFNTAFFKRFHQTSVEMFDTNVYGYPRLFDEANMTLNNKAFHTLIKDKQKYKYVKNPVQTEYQHLNTHNQHIWALIKFLECVSENELTICKKKSYFKEPLQYREQEPLYSTIDQKNMQYASFLRKVKETVKGIEATGQDSTTATDKLIIKYNQLVSHANYHGQETYFSTGPYMDVVVTQQMKIDVEITQDQYMDSFIENIGFAISKLTRTESTRCVPVVVDASKYLLRAWKAYNKINDSHQRFLAPLTKLYEFRGNLILPDLDVLSPFYDLVGVNKCDTMAIRRSMFNHAITIMDVYFRASKYEDEEIQYKHMQSFKHVDTYVSPQRNVFSSPKIKNPRFKRHSGFVEPPRLSLAPTQ